MKNLCECCGRKLRIDEGKVCRFCVGAIKTKFENMQKGGNINAKIPRCKS